MTKTLAFTTLQFRSIAVVRHVAVLLAVVALRPVRRSIVPFSIRLERLRLDFRLLLWHRRFCSRCAHRRGNDCCFRLRCRAAIRSCVWEKLLVPCDRSVQLLEVVDLRVDD